MIKSNLKNLISSWRYLIPGWKKELVILVLTLATAIISLVNPYIAKLIIDKAYGQHDLKLFILLLFFGGLAFIIKSLLDTISQYLKHFILIKVNFTLNKEVFKKIQNLSYIFFQNRTTGEYLYKLNNDVNQIVAFVTDVPPQIIFFTLKFLFTLALLIYLNWKMALLALGLIPFLYLHSYLFTKPLAKKTEQLLQGLENTFETVREIFSNIQLVKVFGKEIAETRRYIRQLINNIGISIANIKLNIISSLAQSWSNKLVFALITFYGGYQIIKGTMSLGTFMAIMMYINDLLGLESYLGGFYERFILSRISWQRLNSILLNAEDEEENKEAEEFLFSSGTIQFRGVTFGYKPGKPVLKHLNFNIEGGTTIGLVGPSGCGKTTILSLLVRLYRLGEGAIFIDGQNINLIKKSSLTEQIGISLQKPLLWNDTVLNNIKYARPAASDKDVFWAAEVCGANDFIRRLGEGYSTVIGEAGTRLSEGQKQRIALARVVIKRPKILIIDEGMSSLDSETEDKIIDNLKQELKNTTIIVVSHRLSTIKKMDLAYFLEDLDKMSIGYYEQLAPENLSFRKLFASQIAEEKILS